MAMIIKSSKSIRNGYKDISELCKTTHEPVHLTVNGEGDLVVMDIKAFYQREKQLDIREQLLVVEADRLRGAPDYPAREVIAEGRAMLRGMAGGAAHE
jgi:PHD/YefM family antitoxin component YafN of YafNO toxin-antitoxin module